MSESNLHSIQLKNSVLVHEDESVGVRTRKKNWTLREKTFGIIILILLSVICGLVITFLVLGSSTYFNRGLNERGENERGIWTGLNSGFSGVCDSVECVDVAHRVIHSGSFTQDPCRDFYAFACANWQKANPIPQEQLYHAANINLLRDNVDARLKSILEEKKENSGDADEEEIEAVNAFYYSCLNYSSTNEDAIVTELVESFGGYQVGESWSDDRFNLTNLTISFLRVNAAPLFDLTLDIDARNNSHYALIVELPRATTLVPNLFQPRHPDDGILPGVSFNLNPERGSSGSPTDSPATLERHRLYEMITDMYEAKKMDQLKELIRKVGLDAKMVEEDLSSDFENGPCGIKVLHMDVNVKDVCWADCHKELQRQFDGIEWEQLLTALMGNNQELGVDWTSIKIYVPYPDYLRKLFKVLNFTNKRLIQNLMMMSYVRDMVNDLTEKTKAEPRWKFCVQSTKSVFAMELSSKYLRSFPKTHLDQVRNDVEEIFVSVKGSLVRFLNDSIWLENGTKEEAIRKIRMLHGHFLAPSFYFKDDYLEDAVKSIDIHPSDFFGNVRLVYRLFREQLYKLYWTGVDEERATWAFVAFPFIVNAFYIQQFNSIVIPLAFLNPPQYTINAPAYINYATIGLTIAHEALHALDGSGSGFDADGRLNDWWNEESRSMLRNKSVCVATQYSAHFHKLISFHETHIPIQVDGNLTQNENMADIAGLQVVYNAYRTQRTTMRGHFGQRSSQDLKIPGVNQTLEQIFFLTVAQAYCANISPMGYIFLLEMDEHTPHPERMNGMLMNIPEFAHAFDCPFGSPMNPVAKCSLW